jgi:uncharacterized membrane protein YagU involved in acid resistance
VRDAGVRARRVRCRADRLLVNRTFVVAGLAGGLLAGLLDIVFAISFAAWNGTAPVRLLQIVASGLVGNAAFSGGAGTAALGLLVHFGLSIAWAGLFLALTTVRPAIALHPYLSGIAFGVVVFLVMRVVVLPLSAFPFPVTFKPLATTLDLLSHMLLFGVPIALAARWAAGRPVALA